jgi:glycosyltransferase involved in cell wall biosynthesis
MTNILVTTMSYDRDHGGGPVRLAYDLASGLARRGHQVSVVCEDLHDSGMEREVIDGVTVYRYRLPRSRMSALRRHEQHIAAATAVMKKNLLDIPQVVHGHSLFQYVAALRLYGGRAKFCYTIHSPFVDELPITWRAQGFFGQIKLFFGLNTIRELELAVLRESSSLASMSNYTRLLIRQHYGNELADKIEVIPGWVDLERFKPIMDDQVELVRRRLNWPNGCPLIFVLRRLEARMGLDNLLKALAIIRQRGYQFHVIIGGSGSQLARLTQLRNELDLQSYVTFIGFVPGDKLALAYGACDVSIIPTAQLECFGIIALEALACGRPALVTPVGALPEVMQNFEPNWIGFGSCPDDIAELLISFLAGKLPVHNADNLRKLIFEHYSFFKSLNAYEKILCYSS